MYRKDSVVAVPFGMVDPRHAAGISVAAWTGLPDQWFGPELTAAAAACLIGPMILMAFIPTTETVGDTSGSP